MSFYQVLADQSIARHPVSEDQALAILRAEDRDIMEIMSAAYRVRHHYRGNRVQIQLLSNIKSGLCAEDCHYCSQSRVSEAPIDKYKLWQKEKATDEAKRATAMDAKRYCMALAGRSPSDREIDMLAEMIRGIKAETPIALCLSIGFLKPEQARRLKEAGLDRVNHNLNTSERHYPDICTTHTYADRVRNLKIVRDAGLEICSGGIIGQGETDEDIFDMFSALRELEPASIPVNFLIPVKGTPFGDMDNHLTPIRCLKTLALVRFMHPDVDIRIAGGREYNLRSMQPLALYAANSIFVEGYLTCDGQKPDDAIRMIEDMGFTLEFDSASEGSVTGAVASATVGTAA